MSEEEYKKCPYCLAYYPNRPDYSHRCDGLMKYLVQLAKRKQKNYEK